MIIDTHCHLASEEFDKDLDEVIDRAKKNSVERIIVVGTDLLSSQKCLALAQAHPGFAATAGIHPHDSSAFQEESVWKSFEELAANPKFCALGETGLDYFYNHSPRETQIEVLKRHIALSKKWKRPLVLHCRDAYEDLAAAIDEEGQGKAFGVIHCFTGNTAQAKSFLDRGFYISFSGIVTFQSANTLREACKTIPSDRLLVETDAPFLAPIPHRGKRNEPSFVRDTLSKIAELRGETLEKVAECTSQNALRLFQLS